MTPKTRQPDFEVVGLGRRKAEIPGAEENHPVGKTQADEHFLGAGDERLQFVEGIPGFHELHELHLVELVLPDKSSRVLSMGPRLATKARCVRHVPRREIPR